jgi:hypothetical protein
VLLHYVGYAYQPKGIPVWLPGALEQWKRGGAQRRLVTMFHEMYARSSPLRSPFWVTPFARRILRRLATISDAWVTSCNRYFRQLTTEFSAPPSRGRIIPIGSNVPVASMLPRKWGDGDATTRKYRFVLFGLAKTRLWALEKHQCLLRALGEAGMIEHVTLLGKHPESEDERTWQRFAEAAGKNISWRKRFDVSSADLSVELAEHDFGFLANEPDILTKSGVFAALATHGVIPIVAGGRNRSLPRILADAAVVNPDTKQTVPKLLDVIRDSNGLRQTRERLLARATRELAWPRITQTWKNVLEHWGESQIVVQREPGVSVSRVGLEVGASITGV